mgnify:CR=1 FL=1
MKQVRLRVEVEALTDGLHCAKQCQFLRNGYSFAGDVRYYAPSCTLFEQGLLADRSVSKPRLAIRHQSCLKAEQWATEPKRTGT